MDLATIGRHRVRRAASVMLVAAFVGLLLAPAARNLAGPQRIAWNERRCLASLPNWSWKRSALEAVPRQFEEFFNDHFGFRNKLIDVLNNVRVRWLRQSSSPLVCIGKKDWLYYTHEPVGMDFECVRPFTNDELERWRFMLEARRDWLAARGITYLFVIAPDKQTIYPEMLPRHLLRRLQAPTRFDQLKAYLRECSSVRVLDLRPALLQAKGDGPLYHETDSHWNDHGGYVAYVRLMEELAAEFPALVPLSRAALVPQSVPVRGGDLAEMLGLPSRYAEARQLLVPRAPFQARWIDAGWRAPHQPDGMQPALSVRDGAEVLRAVLLHDSFAVNVLPYFREHFQRLLCVWKEPYEFDWPAHGGIEGAQPQVVVQQIVERKLGLSFPKACRAGLEYFVPGALK